MGEAAKAQREEATVSESERKKSWRERVEEDDRALEANPYFVNQQEEESGEAEITFAQKVIRGDGEAQPEHDPEVQALVAQGWSPAAAMEFVAVKNGDLGGPDGFE